MGNMMIKFIKRLAKDESGIAAVEYALLLGVISTVIIIAAGTLADSVGDAMDAAGCTVEGGTYNFGTDTCTPA